jgi:CRP-like cAMP-binding protein
MFSQFRKYIEKVAEFSEAEIEFIKAAAKAKRLWKKQPYLQEGEVCQHLVWIGKGGLRLFFMDRWGKEHTIEFGLENEFLTDRLSLAQGSPSIYSIEAIRDSEVLLFSREAIDQLSEAIPGFSKLLRMITIQSLSKYQSRILATLTLSADEKYRTLAKQNPQLLQEVPQHMIASYLGITPATLSRVRKN